MFFITDVYTQATVKDTKEKILIKFSEASGLWEEFNSENDARWETRDAHYSLFFCNYQVYSACRHSYAYLLKHSGTITVSWNVVLQDYLPCICTVQFSSLLCHLLHQGTSLLLSIPIRKYISRKTECGRIYIYFRTISLLLYTFKDDGKINMWPVDRSDGNGKI